jgi:hypothetical protein
VALFVYRRSAQLPRTLECLRANGVEQLYVFSDGPDGESAAADVSAVRELISALDWIEPIVIAREENLGLSSSIRAGLDWLFEIHERAIVIEDDVCVAPEFCEYARLALDRYADEPAVAGITGLRYPFDRGALEGYPFDVFLSPRFSSWAWATWSDRWREMCFDLSELRGRIAAARSFRARRAGADMPGMVHDAVVTERLTGSWDVVCAANMLLHGRYFVTPVWNMVENTGLVEGTHSSGAPAWTLAWEPEHRPALESVSFAPVAEDGRVLRAYLRFFALSRRRDLIGSFARMRYSVAHR